MKIPGKEYDFVIIGSGLGGLECAHILASEGYSVVVLEKNKQLGGNLQVFSRDKSIFDTGVHYIGSLDEGEVLNKFFKYFGILDKLKMKRMDDEGYDEIWLNNGKRYKHGQGYDNFKKNLIRDFPEEEEAIHEFCEKIRDICEKFPLYNLEIADGSEKMYNTDLLEENAAEYLESLTDNEDLRNVLAGSNPLFAGVKEKTPLYVLALILNSYIRGSYKMVNGGSQLAIVMSKSIRKMGGELYSKKEVVGARFNDDKTIREVVLDTGEVVRGKNYISNIHPVETLRLFGEEHFLKVYRRRIKGLENTLSTFIVHLSFKKDSFPYLNYNIYKYHIDDVWKGTDYNLEDWPEAYFICTPATSKSDKYADSMSIMTYMHIDDFEKWKNTFNTVSKQSERGVDYEDFKRTMEKKVLKKLEQVFPDIRESIQNVYSSTPLTFRDYIGTLDGSMYGVLKDSNNPKRTIIDTRTRVPNLYMTGQNIIFHGILGVTIGAFVTCFNFLDKEKIVEEVRKA